MIALLKNDKTQHEIFLCSKVFKFDKTRRKGVIKCSAKFWNVRGTRSHISNLHNDSLYNFFYIVAECDKEMVYKYNTVRNFKKQNVH